MTEITRPRGRAARRKTCHPGPAHRNTTPSRTNRKPRPIAIRARTRLNPRLETSKTDAIGLRALATLNQQKPTGSPELGRSPFWERPSRALPDPEEMPASDPSRPPVGSAVNKGPSEHRGLLFTASFHAVHGLRGAPCSCTRCTGGGAQGATLGCACWPSMKVPELADCPVLVLMRPA